LRPVRRSFYDPTSAPGQGWIWEWENDAGSWTTYDMEVIIALQAAWDRQQPWLDLTSMGFCYFVDFQTMTQINRQTQQQRRIQRHSDMVYPLVSGPLSKTSQAWGTGSGSGGIPCTCQQCMLVLSVKANGTSAQTLGRATKPNSPKSNFGTLPSTSASMSVLNSYSHTLPHGTSLKCSLSEEAKNSATFDQSLSLLTSGLSRPALQRIAMAQSRALIASGVPTVPVKNLNDSSTVHPALAGITGILMSAAGLPVCLTRPPKLVLHPPPVNKSDIRPIPGIGKCCRKTTKKQARKGKNAWVFVRIDKFTDKHAVLQCCFMILFLKAATAEAMTKVLNKVYTQALRLLLVAWDRRLIFSVGTSSTTGESDTVIWNEIHHKTEFGSNLTAHGYPDYGYIDNVLEELKAQGITEDEEQQL
uniref:E3 ubiquitin-protein ligase n=1 Tax=Sinocyclocheilus rhinocerous TaxID=307959 RepID=A0A673G8H3_9TELE